MAKGIRQSTGDVVVLWDADQMIIRDDLIFALVYPLINYPLKMVVGKHIYTNKRAIGLNWRLTGERAFWLKDLTKITQKFEKVKFGLEVFFNEEYKTRMTIVPLYGTKTLIKSDKTNPPTVIKQYLEEGMQIAIQLARMRGDKLKKNFALEKDYSKLINKYFPTYSKYIKQLKKGLF